MKHCWKIKALNEIRLNCSGALSNIAVTPYSPVDRCFMEWEMGKIWIWEHDYSTAIVVGAGYALLTQTFGIRL